MKVAVCISGQPRNVHKGFPFIERNLLNPNTCDVFIHVWWDEEQIGKPYINAGGHVATKPLECNVLDDIVKLYDPTLIQYEPQKDFNEKNYAQRAYPAISPFASLSQKYSAMKAHELRRKFEQEYDAVVRLRFDFALRTMINISEFNLDMVNTPNRCTHPGGVDDTFAISNPANMDIYGDLYKNMGELYDSGVPFCDEILLGQWLRINKIPVALHSIDYDLIRG